ncbi:hypothetical protein [Chroococcidiopsis sp [FACHB-1243]]|nr:hypothetical protein [Chroococcidiopsis sp. [FACHB-1243]]
MVADDRFLNLLFKIEIIEGDNWVEIILNRTAIMGFGNFFSQAFKG